MHTNCMCLGLCLLSGRTTMSAYNTLPGLMARTTFTGKSQVAYAQSGNPRYRVVPTGQIHTEIVSVPTCRRARRDLQGATNTGAVDAQTSFAGMALACAEPEAAPLMGRSKLTKT